MEAEEDVPKRVELYAYLLGAVQNDMVIQSILQMIDEMVDDAYTRGWSDGKDEMWGYISEMGWN